jgi:hypothetical protein
MPRPRISPLTLVGAALIFVLGVGGLGAHYWVSYSVDRDVARLRGIIGDLAARSPDFAALRVVRSTHPKAWVFGTVPSESAAGQLREAVANSFGQEEAARIVSQVHVRATAAIREGGT